MECDETSSALKKVGQTVITVLGRQIPYVGYRQSNLSFDYENSELHVDDCKVYIDGDRLHPHIDATTYTQCLKLISLLKFLRDFRAAYDSTDTFHREVAFRVHIYTKSRGKSSILA